jgi:predicted ArsR family transcriptional regulator
VVKTTRQRILDYLASHPGATAAGLSAALQVTPADVRHHLARLQDEGVVVRSSAPPHPASRPGRGRPARRYSLPRPAPAPALLHLLAALLAEACDPLPPPEWQAFLRRLAARLAGEPPPAAGLSQRLVFAVRRLNSLGYRARWEARAAGPRLTLEHSPLSALQPGLPQLASLEAHLLEALLGASASRVEIVRPPAPLEIDQA